MREIYYFAFNYRYIIHWKEKFKHTAIERIIPSIKVDSSHDKYYFLSPLIKEDEELRHRLKLEITLKRQEYERTDENYENICLFCRLQLKGSIPRVIPTYINFNSLYFVFRHPSKLFKSFIN